MKEWWWGTRELLLVTCTPKTDKNLALNQHILGARILKNFLAKLSFKHVLRELNQATNRQVNCAVTLRGWDLRLEEIQYEATHVP